MKRTEPIAICDLNNAVAALKENKQSNTTCILAQFAMRVLNVPKVVCGYNDVWVNEMTNNNPTLSITNPKVGNLVLAFDAKEFAKVRRQLPLEVEIEVLD